MMAIGEGLYDAPSSFADFIDTDLQRQKLIGAAPTAGSPAEAELGPLVYPAVLDGGPYSLILSSADPGAGSCGRHY